ncbi:hypothetical protein [Aureimonas jatrophae]|uniref:Uncharacterized protein n=1 Tax=Aureimonas jatrophae TaxID=1166073 RepID=A0A1H0J9S9_9HYPH|nr:hypothetical protein [Aureimonas jatrophae]MBB3951516.1 hypothetical protein [Aureimonas jatrophae]SDO40525.1 hypothetical protein SAMN05192530_10679 [Aureimonas jatrophae]
MGNHPYAMADHVRNAEEIHDRIVVNDEFPYRALALGQVELLNQIPAPGSSVPLDEALAIVGRHHCNPYVQIVVLMNRGLLAADFEDGSHADPEIVLRRV